MERRECTYCPEPGADVCVRTRPEPAGADTAVYAHAACAERRHVPVLYRLFSESDPTR